MKNLIYFLALFFAVIYAASCDTKSAGPDVNPPPPPPPADVISEATYNIWRGNWKNHGKSFIANEDSILRYFTMPTIDLEEFLDRPGNGPDTVAAARFTLGMEISGTDSIPHIMLLGVNSNGDPLTNSTRFQYIYDVTKPCPNSCGKDALPDKK